MIVSVDCGIRAPEAARRARELGVDLIITDHHEPDAELPRALAVVNPKRARLPLSRQAPGRRRRGPESWCRRLCQKTGRDGWLPAFVKIAAIGTLADVVPLVGENRVIAKLGLEMLSRGPHKVGLRALLDVSGLTGKTIDSYHIAFMVAPRMNAAGRMSTADIATRLLLASDEALAGEAQALAQQLDAENTRRRDEEREIVAAARKAVETDPDIGAHPCSSSAGKAGIGASSASSPPSSSMRSTVRPSCCRSTGTWRTAHAEASRASMSWPHSSRARTCWTSSADTNRPPGSSWRASDIPAFRRAVNDYAARSLGSRRPAAQLAPRWRARLR